MPLSEYEQRVLAELERQLSSDDPKLVTSLAAPPAPRRGRIALGILIGLAGLSLLVIGMSVSMIWLSLVGFGVMFAGGYLAVSAPKRGAAAQAVRPPKPPRRRGFTQRFEDRWNRRQGS